MGENVMVKQPINEMIAFESGELSDEKTLKLFSKLIKSGLVWKLQGHYGRTADNLIKTGYLDRKGKILRKV